jgi:hypothetical protein
MILYDGYVDASRPENIYANAIWMYDPEANTLALEKVSNWYRSGGVTVALPENSTDPTPYDRHSYGNFIYAPDKDALYLFGGANTTAALNGYLGDSWRYSFATHTWTQITAGFPANPYVCLENTAAYDPERHKMVVTGADYSRGFQVPSRHVAELDVNTQLWTTSSVALMPHAALGGMADMATCWDPVRKVIWMFGGSGESGQQLNELYSYNPATATFTTIPVSGSWPSARRFTHLAYDTNNNVVIMHGGVTNATGPDTTLTDTWALNPATAAWSQLTPSLSPPASATQYAMHMDYDPVRNVFVLEQNGIFYLYRYAAVSGSPNATVANSVQAVDSVRRIVSRTLTETIHASDEVFAGQNPFLVPLTVAEVLTLGVSGKARTATPVTSGVPVPDSLGFTSVGQLGVQGVSALQIQELARHPSGNLKAVLLDFQCDVPAGGQNQLPILTAGTGNFGGANMGTDNGISVVVDTGAGGGVFTIQKTSFRLFDTVVVGGVTLVASGGEGLALIDGGVRFSSANDTTGTVTIETNGPVRVCVKASGTLRDSGGVRKCEYLVRLHFYRGKPTVRAWVSLRNAKGNAQTTYTFDSIELAVQLSLGATKTFTTKTTQGTVTDTVASGETAYVYQACSSKYRWSENEYSRAPMLGASGAVGSITQRGIEVKKTSGFTYFALTGNDAHYADGWMAMEDASGRGATVGLKWMAQFWPAGLEASGDGTMRIELFSKRNTKTAIKAAWGAYETREVAFDFHTAAPSDRDEFLYWMQYPAFARCPLSYYASTGFVFGENHLVSAQEQQQWFADHGATSPSLANIEPKFIRYHYWPDPGGGNQMDFSNVNIIDFLRTGLGGFWADGERNTQYKADTAVVHSDGFDYTTNQINAGDEGGGTNLNTFNGRTFDFEHSHWISLHLGYLLSGNELFREAIVDYGEHRLGMADGASPNYYMPLSTFCDAGDRGTARYLRDFTYQWEITRDARHRTNLRAMVDQYLNTYDVPGNLTPCGRNLDRGYIYSKTRETPESPQQISDFITVQMVFEALYEAKRVLALDNDTRVPALEDLLLGLAQFIAFEFFFHFSDTLYDYGYVYHYWLSQRNDATNPGWGQSQGGVPPEVFRPISSARAMSFLYEMTGDTTALDKQVLLLKGDVGYVTVRTSSEWHSQACMWYDINGRPPRGWRDIPGVSFSSLGGGSYQLSWTVPSGATGYRIRYFDGKAVQDWLGFNQDTRAFASNPATNRAWFAATHYDSVPTPGASGSTETVTLTGLPVGLSAANFKARYNTLLAGTAISKELSETVQAVDSALKGPGKLLAELASASDSVRRSLGRTLSDVAATSDATVQGKVRAQVATDTVLALDSEEHTLTPAPSQRPPVKGRHGHLRVAATETIISKAGGR